MSGPHVEVGGRDVLAMAKTVAANEFPVERPSVIGVDRETGNLVRLSPFPWKGNDTDPPIMKWGWLHVNTAPDQRDPRPETVALEGEVSMTAYLDAKDAWRLRWPFVRPHLRGSLESLQELARERIATAGFVRPAHGDVVQLPLRYRFRCDSDSCTTTHELPILDWEIREMARLTRERYGQQWATHSAPPGGQGCSRSTTSTCCCRRTRSRLRSSTSPASSIRHVRRSRTRTSTCITRSTASI